MRVAPKVPILFPNKPEKKVPNNGKKIINKYIKKFFLKKNIFVSHIVRKKFYIFIALKSFLHVGMFLRLNAYVDLEQANSNDV